MKPQRAVDMNVDKVKFPCIVSPKVDGVRGCIFNGNLTGRSLKKFKNKHVTESFSKPELAGFDGELVCGSVYSDDLCRATTSAVNTIEGQPSVKLLVFDFLGVHRGVDVSKLPYDQRLAVAATMVLDLNQRGWGTHIELMPRIVCVSKADLLAYEKDYLALGFEGVIARAPGGLHKEGYATVTTGAYLRLKRFTDAEMHVTGIEEAQTNNNEATVNELGKKTRSSHKANKTGAGRVGALLGFDIKHGGDIKIAAGKMTHEEAVAYFKNPKLIVGKTVKYQHFAHGQKDKPRFGTFQCIRADEDA